MTLKIRNSYKVSDGKSRGKKYRGTPKRRRKKH